MKLINQFKNLDKRSAIYFASFLAISAIVFLTAKNLNIDLNSLGITLLVLTFSLLTILTMSLAGIVVFESLFVVGASLTLMIFIAQSYCDVPVAMRTTDSALKSLFGFGLVYVVFLFGKSLYKELTKSLTHLDKIYDGKKPWLIVILFGLFVGLFLWQLYQVINPIVHNLCIYT